MGVPQFILSVIYAMSLGLSLANHGKPKEGYENFWTTLIATTLVFGLLSWGGFFG